MYIQNACFLSGLGQTLVRCATCSVLKVTQERRHSCRVGSAKAKRACHQLAGDTMYAKSKHDVVVLSIDLQQTLPTPNDECCIL